MEWPLVPLYVKMVRPLVTREHAISLASDIFNLNIDSSSQSAVKELDSYDDRNFYVRATKEGIEREYVLKVSNRDDSEYEGLLEEQNTVMFHLDKGGIPCSVPQRTASGKYLELRPFAATPESHPFKRAKKDVGEELILLHKYAVRLFTFIPGKTMRDVPNCTTDVCFKVGSFAAEMHKVLKDLKCPVLENRCYHWDLYNFHEAKKFSGIITDPHQKQLLCNIEKSFKIFVQPKLDTLPEQCIHGDINDANVIVQNIPGSTEFKICGLIDFGDTNHSCRVFDISIAAAHMMTMFLDDPVTAGANTFAGYQEINPLTQIECDLVFYLIQARLYQNICYATNASELHPENSEYLLYPAKRAWKVLDNLATISKKEFDEKWAKLSIPN